MCPAEQEADDKSKAEAEAIEAELKQKIVKHVLAFEELLVNDPNAESRLAMVRITVNDTNWNAEEVPKPRLTKPSGVSFHEVKRVTDAWEIDLADHHWKLKVNVYTNEITATRSAYITDKVKESDTGANYALFVQVLNELATELEARAILITPSSPDTM